jgi:hypothetical protein
MEKPQEELNNAEKINQLLVLALRLPNEDFKTLVDSLVSRLPKDNSQPEKESKYISGCDPYVTYSEREVLELLKKSHFVEQNIEEWFEQNKKK